MPPDATQVPVFKAALLVGVGGLALYEASTVVPVPWYVWLAATAVGGVIMYGALVKSGAY
jgi:hypothetical protein